MTDYKEILRLNSLEINNSQIASSLGCSRTTVITVLRRANECGITQLLAVEMSNKELAKTMFPSETGNHGYKLPDYEYVHREMAKSGVNLQLLWFEYCDKCNETELTLMPVELGFNLDDDLKGLPSIASADEAKNIFDQLCRISEPYNTKMVLKDNIIEVIL